MAILFALKPKVSQSCVEDGLDEDILLMDDHEGGEKNGYSSPLSRQSFSLQVTSLLELPIYVSRAPC